MEKAQGQLKSSGLVTKQSSAALRDADRIYIDLKEKILTLKVEPGAALDEAQIVQQMGTSRTPVREAVIRLVSEGLLRRDGRRVTVSTFQVSELRAFFEGLTLMTRIIQRLAAARRNAVRLMDIKEAMLAFENAAMKNDEVRISEANQAFHVAIARAADSSFIQKAYEDLLTESLRLSRQCFAAGEDEETQRRHLEETCDDHRKIYRAIEQRDVRQADDLANEHCSSFRERLSRLVLGPSTDVSAMGLEN